MPIRWHDDDAVLLQEAIRFTAAQTGFIPRLIEKDYFCSVVLEYLATNHEALIFKGGTCLAKIHAGFYRLSEDLDFSVSTPSDSSRSERRKVSTELKKLIVALPKALPAFRILQPLQGANNSTQYVAVVAYESLLDSHVEPVSIEVGLREPQIAKPYSGLSKTVLLNPLDGQAMVAAFPVYCLSLHEAMAEKLRAALCRLEVAIRDFFDVDFAVHQTKKLDIHDQEWLELLRQKIAMPGTAAVDVTSHRLAQLHRQLDAQLKPVLREQDFSAFNLERAIETVIQVSRELER
ncbi:MAG: nucleotidyl transferase AbiEii/AbiGii toxin family protein [Gammaproteobacteria bacterium]|nr:nucleotidyl transferase AbiEii/AbiGii toxin family protein [Gammaproteobacteria bacterium]